MRVVNVDHPKSMEEAVRIIQSGGTIAHATETCYGFACDLTNLKAVEKLFAIKKRPENQPVSALFASVEDAKEWVLWDEVVEELSQKYLPGPLTLVLPLKKSAQGFFPCPKKEQKTLGVRISSHPIAHKLAKLSRVPLSTTSANLHGEPNPYSVEEIERQFDSETLQPDLVLDSGLLEEEKPSTVVAVEEGKARILRQGIIHI